MIEKLFELQDKSYKEFHKKLIPTVNENRIIGIRTPVLRKLAKDLDEKEAQAFIESLPHQYYEENNLHAFILERIKDFAEALFETERFLPYIDNWATCDSFMPKIFKKHKNELLPYVLKWIKSGKTYMMRYGIGILMKVYLDEAFLPEFLDIVSAVKSEEYYVMMMQAWFFQEALFKQYESSIIYIEEKRLPRWVHNKAISKSLESFRISDEQKVYLKSLKIK